MVSVTGRELLTEFRVPSPKELQELRKKVGLTQAELANSVGISQSLVARIEKGQVNPSISTLKRILEVIEKQQQVHSSVGDLIRWKGQSSKLNPLIWVGPKDTVRRAVILMRRHGISQLPVLKGNSSVGSISEGLIFRQLMSMESQTVFGLSVQEIMEAPFPTISIRASLESALSEIASGVEAILVLDDNRPVGIITKIDVIAFTKI
ncbi:MAG: CBS domain-containing protein [Candidatus Hermodarchaeia archaeon]